MPYYLKYLKYKNKYLNLLGGEIRANNCKSISIFCNKLLKLHSENDIVKINDLYIENILLFKSTPFNNILLVNLNYLLGIKIEDITNEEIKKILQDTYNLLIYNENPIKPDFKETIGVWYKSFIFEDFWRCSIFEFMNEFDNFEITKQSYALYWTNLINLSSLLCRMKTCNYYFISITGEKINIRYIIDNIDDLYASGAIIDFNTIRVGELKLKALKRNYPNAKYICKYINDISNEKIIELTYSLMNSLNCEYQNIHNFYYLFMCSIIDLEHHNKDYIYDIVDLVGPIKKICGSGLKDDYLYLSLNLPKDSTFARNEYTNIICTSVNSLLLIDNVPLSMTQIIGHDYYFHKAKIRKSNYNKKNKKDFREFVDYLNILNIDKEWVFKMVISRLKDDIFKINDDIRSKPYILLLNELRDNFLIEHANDYDYLEMLGIVQYLFHEQTSELPFNKVNFVGLINKLINSNINVGDKSLHIKYNLKLIVLSAIDYYQPFAPSSYLIIKKEDNNRLYNYLKNRIQIIFGELYIDDQANKFIEDDKILFFKAYLKKYNELNSFIINENNFFN